MIFTFLDLTIRVGCHLTYEATAPTPEVFMRRPRVDDAHVVTIEKRSFAVDGAFVTIHGEARLSYFEVWTYQVNPKEVGIGDPVDLSKRLDGSSNIRLS